MKNIETITPTPAQYLARAAIERELADLYFEAHEVSIRLSSYEAADDLARADEIDREAETLRCKLAELRPGWLMFQQLAKG